MRKKYRFTTIVTKIENKQSKESRQYIVYLEVEKSKEEKKKYCIGEAKRNHTIEDHSRENVLYIEQVQSK